MLLQFYNANLARTEGFQLLVVAKGGDMDAGFRAYFQDGLTGPGKDLFPVYYYSGHCHSCPFLSPTFLTLPVAAGLNCFSNTYR
ncbi:hypothetical protein ES708_02571 [subsurface metagenome]